MPREQQDRPASASGMTWAAARRPATLAWLAAIATLAGCAAGPPNTRVPAEPDLPSAWAGASPASGVAADRTAAASPAWWQGFGDPLLTQLVAQARQSNTSVRAAQAALQQARALRNVAAAGLQPTVTGSASAQHGTSGSHRPATASRWGWTPAGRSTSLAPSAAP